MKYYIQFYDYSVPGPWNNNKRELIEACGSDGVYILDGRLSQYNMILKGHDRAYTLRHVKKYPAFRIIKCNGKFDAIVKQSPIVMIKG